MKKTFKKILHFAKRMVTEYGRDNTFELGAALAYYTIFSIVPLLVVVIAVSGIVAGPDAVRGQVFGQLTGLVGPDTAKALQDMGMTNVAHIDGGWADWTKAGAPTESLDANKARRKGTA